MGCDKVCKAKKKAKAAKKQAADAQKQAKKTPSMPGVPKVSTVTANVVTVGDVLNVSEKYQALTPWEAMLTVGQGRRNSQVMASAAKGLVTPIQAAFGTYAGLIGAQFAFTIIKPIVKMAVNIGGLIFNFANIGELLQDIALLLLMIFVGLAPIFLSLLKNIFFTIPVDVGILTTYQLDQLKDLVAFAKIGIKNTFQNVVINIKSFNVIQGLNAKEQQKATLGGYPDPYQIDFSGLSSDLSALTKTTPTPFDLDLLLSQLSPPMTREDLKDEYIKAFESGMAACREQILEQLGEELKNQKINILDIDGVSAFDTENKNKAKAVASGLNDASKRIELLQAGEVLKRQFSVSGQQPTEEGQVFDDNDLAVAAAELMLAQLDKQILVANDGRDVDADDPFLNIFDQEIEKKKGETTKIREDLASLELAQELILDNKNAFIASMINKISLINLDSTGCVNLDPCYESAISNQFTDLKTTTQTQQTSFINGSTINTTQDMITLRDSVYGNVQQAVNDSAISVDSSCQTAFGESVCSAIDCFKSKLYAEIKVSIEEGSFAIDTLDVPVGIDRFELKSMLNYLLDEVKKKIIEQARNIIVEEIVPCKSCKPCEDMVADMGIYTSKSINKSKDNIIKHVEGQIINNTSLDWTITDAQSITDKKNLLISELNIALSRDAGELQLVDDMLFRLKAEEKELIKNVKTALTAIAQ